MRATGPAASWDRILASGGADCALLLIRPTALGDVCRTVPALVTLRRALPHARIDWLVHEGYGDAIRQHPALSGVVPFPRATLGRFWRAPGPAWQWLQSLRQRRYQVTIDLQGLARSGWTGWASGAPLRLGYANARELAPVTYNLKQRIDPQHHEVHRSLGLLEALGLSREPDMRLYVSSDDDMWAQQRLEAAGLEPGAQFAALAPTAKWLCKCWPIDRYIDLAQRLLESGDAGRLLVVLAAPSERAYIQPLVDALPAGKVLAPSTTVGQTMALIRRSRLLICNDSAPMHMAVGFDTPMVAIFGPTNPARTGPYGRDASVVMPAGHDPRTVHYRANPQDQSLIATIPLEDVWRRAMAELEARPVR